MVSSSLLEIKKQCNSAHKVRNLLDGGCPNVDVAGSGPITSFHVSVTDPSISRTESASQNEVHTQSPDSIVKAPSHKSFIGGQSAVYLQSDVCHSKKYVTRTIDYDIATHNSVIAQLLRYGSLDTFQTPSTDPQSSQFLSTIGQHGYSTPVNLVSQFNELPSFNLDFDGQIDTHSRGLLDQVSENQSQQASPMNGSTRAGLNQHQSLIRPKRNTMLPPAQRSPFVERVVDIDHPCSREVNMLMSWVICCSGVPMVTIFQSESGQRGERFMFESLCPNEFVFSGTVDCFVEVLNHNKKYRNKQTSSYFFAKTSVTTPAFMDFKGNFALDDYNIFRENLLDCMGSSQALRCLYKIDMVFFPACRGSHYFVVAFDLKHRKILVIDNVMRGIQGIP